MNNLSENPVFLHKIKDKKYRADPKKNMLYHSENIADRYIY